MELCYEVMAADGVAEIKELKVIREIGDILNIDANEIEKMRDKNLVNLSTDSITSPSVEDVLGIDKNWPKDKIKEQLTSEFKKWNSRMTSLPEGDEKSNAQSMLNKIADLRKIWNLIYQIQKKWNFLRYLDDLKSVNLNKQSINDLKFKNFLFKNGLLINQYSSSKIDLVIEEVCKNLHFPRSSVNVFVYSSSDIQGLCYQFLKMRALYNFHQVLLI